MGTYRLLWPLGLVLLFACQQSNLGHEQNKSPEKSVGDVDSIKKVDKAKVDDSIIVKGSWDLMAEIEQDSLSKLRVIKRLGAPDAFPNKSNNCYYHTSKQHSFSVGGFHFQVFYNCGFKDIQHVITVWDLGQDSTYYFRQIFDNALEEGIGHISIKDVIPLGNETFAITGKAMGGDGGYTWGSSWLGYWYQANRFEVLERH